MNLATINVVLTDGAANIRVHSWPDHPQGVILAIATFKQLARRDGVVNEAELSAALDQGYLSLGLYTLFLTHSTTVSP